MQCVIYKTDEGGVAVVLPNLSCGLTIDEIARKDVPTGKAYKIINVDDLPSRETRDAWTVDSAMLTDGVGQ